jgi:hypothetical protein
MDGSARIGVTFGLLNHMFPEFIKKAKESLEKGSAYPSRFVYSGLTNLRVMKLSPIQEIVMICHHKYYK